MVTTLKVILKERETLTILSNNNGSRSPVRRNHPTSSLVTSTNPVADGRTNINSLSKKQKIPFTNIINHCISTSTVPSEWKTQSHLSDTESEKSKCSIRVSGKGLTIRDFLIILHLTRFYYPQAVLCDNSLFTSLSAYNFFVFLIILQKDYQERFSHISIEP